MRYLVGMLDLLIYRLFRPSELSRLGLRIDERFADWQLGVGLRVSPYEDGCPERWVAVTLRDDPRNPSLP